MASVHVPECAHAHLWLLFAFVVAGSFAVLGWIGTRIYQEAPPIPDVVITSEGKIVIPSDGIQRGQNVWQTLGGMEVGSVWGHGSYVAPDWTADWLHREAEFLLNHWARGDGHPSYADLPLEKQAQLCGRLQEMMRKNTYDLATGRLVIDPVRAEAFEAGVKHYAQVFAKGEPGYAIPAGALVDPQRQHDLAAFFLWTAWAAAAERPGEDISYTHNWPHEPLVDNVPTGQRLGVNLLFLTLLVIVVGSLAGEWLSIMDQLSDETAFYFGHQGYEYIDLGRVWQIGLFVGLLLWLFLVIRSVLPALKQPNEGRQLLLLFLVSAGAIGLFYGAGLMWGRHTNLSIVEYWQW